jgi:SAM-dependent methyltransferase
MNRSEIPPDVDVSVPNVARMYDYYLGGDHYFGPDRIAAEQVIERFPQVRYGARANRAFLRRAVDYMTRAGIRQFLDIGTGLPTQGQVHQVAPAARVVYVDNDPIVVTYARALLAEPERITIIEGDLREPDEILAHPKTTAFIDWDQPVGLLMLAVLHFIPDDQDPRGLIAAFTRRMAPGSHVAVSHATWDESPAADDDHQTATRLYDRSSAASAVRSRGEVAALLDDLDLVEPGVVWLPDWRNEETVEQPQRSMAYCAVARTA